MGHRTPRRGRVENRLAYVRFSKTLHHFEHELPKTDLFGDALIHEGQDFLWQVNIGGKASRSEPMP